MCQGSPENKLAVLARLAYSIAEMLSEAELDAVSITLPTYMHRDLQLCLSKDLTMSVSGNYTGSRLASKVEQYLTKATSFGAYQDLKVICRCFEKRSL